VSLSESAGGREFKSYKFFLDKATAPTNTALSWAKSLRRFAELCLSLRHETHTRLLVSHLTDRGKTPPEAKKFNTTVAPLASLKSAFQIKWSDDLYEEPFRQELEKYIKYGRYAPPGGASACHTG
jgi:hypothetical protein